MSVTIDDSGARAPSFEEILQSFRAGYQQIYGVDTWLGDDSQDGQWLAVQSQGVHNANQALIAAFLSFSPSFAVGAGLASLVKINGLRKQTPSRSTVELTLVGQVGTTVDAGIVADQNNNLWNLPARVVIPATGEITVTATAQNPGAITAGPGAVSRIQTLMPGWQSVTNATPATVGFPLETDAQLRRRQAVSTSLPAITPLLAIWGAIANVRGVGRSKVYENDTSITDSLGIPSHSIAAVVSGGDDYEIAEVIARKKNVGCGTYGTTHVLYYEPPAAPLPVNFFRLVELEIWVQIWITPLTGYLNSTGGLARAAVAAYINGLDIGDNVRSAWLCPPASLSGAAAVASSGRTQEALDRLSATYVLDQILIGTSAGAIDQHDLVIPFLAAAVTDINHIILSLN